MKKAARLSKWYLIRQINKLINLFEEKTYSSKKKKALLIKNAKKIYQCQWASPELVERIVNHKMDASSDPRWKDFGFSSKKEYGYWSWRICAIASLKMALNFFYPKNNTKISEIVNFCLSFNGYNVTNDKGWYHSSLIKYLESRNLKTNFLKFLSLRKLKTLLENRTLVLTSISETPKVMNPLEDGHIIVICGLEFKKNKAFIHYLDSGDPILPMSGKTSVMPWDEFIGKRYLFRAITVSNERKPQK